jgi:hypothetical protein
MLAREGFATSGIFFIVNLRGFTPLAIFRNSLTTHTPTSLGVLTTGEESVATHPTGFVVVDDLQHHGR